MRVTPYEIRLVLAGEVYATVGVVDLDDLLQVHGLGKAVVVAAIEHESSDA